MLTSLVFSKAKTGMTTMPKIEEPKTKILTKTTIASCNSCNKK